MDLSKRSLLVITPVVLLSFLVASLVVYEQTQIFVARQEQNRLNYVVSQLSSAFNQYTTFAESYLHAITESHALHEYLQVSNHPFRELALGNSLEDSLETFKQHRSDYLSLTIASNASAPEISYYFEISADPFSTISQPLAAFAFSAFDSEHAQRWDYVAPPGERNTIVKAQLLDRYTFASPIPTQLDYSVVVQLAVAPTEFNALRAQLEQELGATIAITDTLSAANGLTASAELGEMLFLQVTLPANHLQQQMRPLVIWLILISLLFAVTASLCLHGLVRRYVTRPVSLLEEDLSDVLARRRTTIPLRSTGNDEISRLARSFRTLHEDLVHSNEATQRLIQRDSLTGLYNLPYISDIARTALLEAADSGEQVTLLYLDLDNFKFVNDKYGHKFGDELLTAFAQHLVEVASSVLATIPDPKPQMLTGRVAGDQFCLFARHPEAFSITQNIAERILHLLEDGLMFANAHFPITVSIGIAVYPRDADSVSQLISSADTAMHQAKLLGKNQMTLYSQELAAGIRRRQEIEAELKVLDPDKEFRLVYMPLLNVKSGELDGFEVLLRWESLKLGNVKPDEFVPIAESSGTFTMIDDWVIRNGLASYPIIRTMLGRDFKLSLNISSAQLQLSNLIDVLDHYTSEFGIAPHCIQLEITETANIDYTPYANSFLHRLSASGYQLALDDFGAGFTSLLRIVEYPVTMVKFDKKFIQQTLKQGNRQILKPLVELCHSHGMLVTMEGAETQEDIDLLHTFDCDYIQGYFLGRPISLADMEEAMATLRTRTAQVSPQK